MTKSPTMRYLAPLFILLLFSSSSFCQLDWEELPAYNAETIEILYASEDREILGRLHYPPKLVYSDNIGKDWTVLVEGDELTEKLGNYLINVAQDDQGALYISASKTIYTIDVDANRLVPFITLDIWVRDFEFLPNGNIVAGNGNGIYLFSSEGDLISEVSWDIRFLEFLIGSDDRHYIIHGVGSTPYIDSFNSDLSLFFPAELNEALFFEEYRIMNDRIFANSAYSDDGISWIDYGVKGFVVPFENGNVVLYEEDNVYHSQDMGETWTESASAPQFFIAPHAFNGQAIDDESILFWRDAIFCSQDLLIFSRDGMTGHVEIDSGIGNPMTDFIEASSKDKVYSSYCSLVANHKLNDEKEWTSFHTGSFNSFCDNTTFVTTEDGSILCRKACLSNSEGLIWERKTELPIPSEFWIKNGVVYVFGENSLLHSEDQGTTWVESPYQDQSLIDQMVEGVIYPVGVSSTGYLYFVDEIEEEAIIKTDIEGNILNLLSMTTGVDPVTFHGFRTSYVGSDLFILSSSLNANEQLVLSCSYDDGVSFTDVDLGFISYDQRAHLETDPLGNVYVHTEWEIWMSEDKGLTWTEITPSYDFYYEINDIDISWDGYVFVSTFGTPVLRAAVLDEGINATDDDFVLDELVVYPQPASDIINVIYSGDRQIEYYQLVDPNGRNLIHGPCENEFSIPIGSLSSGLYTLRLETGTDNVTQKVVVQK